MSPLPKAGIPSEELDRLMAEARAGDVDWRRGRIGVYVHFAGDDVLEVAKRAYLAFFSENGLGPAAFPSLARFERDVIAMTLGLLHGGPQARGSMTSGGTESIFLAVRSARDESRRLKPHVEHPLIVAPQTAHPAFDKAAQFLGVRVVRVPVAKDFRADPEAMEKAIGPETIMLVGSAPAFPHGVVDPIAELGAVAERHGVWLHVDACVGGFIAPFAKRLGAPIPDFDFAIPSVTSISADLHKYGYTAKGASTILYRDEAAFSNQAYTFTDWPRGRYATNTLIGTRPGGAIAAAWAVMNYLGEEGYLRVTERVLATRRAFEEGVTQLGLEVWGKPELSIIGYGSSQLDIFAVAERMERRGWYVGKLLEPPGLHLMLNLTHEPIVVEYMTDLEASLKEVRRGHVTSNRQNVTY
jgi:glutamate/tyrosine decarboxylase-like PLP-dependent enzyme